jgi:RimJ/RimL family protein N-acetyltransferase
VSSLARSEGIQIRRLSPDDWEEFRVIRLAALADAPSAFGSTLAREQAFLEQDWRTRLSATATFVAMAAGRIAGTAGGVRDRARPDDAMLVGMWVAPEARARGVGEALVRSVIAWATEAHFPRITLFVTVGNEPAARLYARCGFVPTGVEEPVDADRPEQMEMEMELRLR